MATNKAAKAEGSEESSGGTSSCPACGAENVRLKSADGVKVCDKCASKKFSSKVQKAIQAAFEQQQLKQQRDSYARRLQITKLAQDSVARGKIGEALQHYDKYLQILETRFRIQRQNIHPHLFDQKTDDQELLLCTAVFWELAKIHDRQKSAEHYALFKFYISKYVEFSLGAPYMILSAETLRKYMKSDKVSHKKEFEQAHTALRSQLGKCFIAGVLLNPMSDESTLNALYHFRDEKLLPRKLGKQCVALYYAVGPSIALFLAPRPRLRRALAPVLRKLAFSLPT